MTIFECTYMLTKNNNKVNKIGDNSVIYDKNMAQNKNSNDLLKQIIKCQPKKKHALLGLIHFSFAI